METNQILGPSGRTRAEVIQNDMIVAYVSDTTPFSVFTHSTRCGVFKIRPVHDRKIEDNARQYAIPRQKGIQGLKALEISIFNSDGQELHHIAVPDRLSRPGYNVIEDVRALVHELKNSGPRPRA